MSFHRNSNWADGPFPLIPTPFGPRSAEKEHGSMIMAQAMAHIHNCLLRSLNAIYQQAPYVKESADINDFLHLVKLWHDELHHHHQTEEDVFFPRVEEITGVKGIMDGNVEQHHAFEPGLKAVKKFAEETKPEDYDGYKLRAVIESFGDILQRHLNEEITTLLGLQKYPSEKLIEAWEAAHEHVLKTCDQTVQLPILLGSFDVNFEGRAVGPPLPWFLPYLVHYWFERKHKAAWRFLPCTTWGKPRPLLHGPYTAKA